MIGSSDVEDEQDSDQGKPGSGHKRDADKPEEINVFG
jgi:hypothetical protein